MVFEQVQADLEAAGYEVQPFILPACGKNAPHRRDRIWFVAHAGSFDSPLSIQQWGQDKAKDIDTNRRGESGIIADESLKGYGNAVVPQIVYEIFKAIETYDAQ